MKKKIPIRSVAGLPNKAKKKPRAEKDPLKDLSEQDVRDLLNKLTRENKELRRAKKDIEASRQQFADLYDFAPVGYFTFDRSGVVLEVNHTGAAMLGVERTKLVKTPLMPFVSKKDRDKFNNHCQKVFRTGKRLSCELELTRKNGKAFFAKLESVPADSGAFRAVMNDITKRNKAGEALRESEEKYRGIFDRANDGIIAYDLKVGKFLFVNKSMSELTGHSGKEILKLAVKDLHPEKDLPFVLKEFEAMASGEKTVTKDIPVLKKDGSVIYCDIGSSFLGKTTLLGFFRDVTDRKLAEDRINHFASFPQLNPNPVMEADAAGKVIFCNPATQKILESMGLDKGDAAVFLPADLEQIIKEPGKKGEASFYREVVVKERIFGETVYLPSQAKTARIYAYDITERKQAEEALRSAHNELESRVQERTMELEEANKVINAEKQRFYDVLEMLPTYVVLLTPDYHVPFANRFFRERFGDSGGRRCYEYLFERTEPCQICDTYNVLKTDSPHHWEWTGPDDRNYDIFDFPFKDNDGSPLIMEVGIDITELKQAERTLREMNETLEQRIAERTAELESANALLLRSQEDMNRAQEVGSIGSWRLDVRQNLLTWSDENHRIFGVPKGSPMTYETFLSAVHPEDRIYVDTKWKAGLAGDTYDIEHRILVDGRVKWVREKAYIEFDKNNELHGALGITQDITERKLAEEALIRSESKYRSLFTNMINGLALQKIITDAEGRPVDYTFIEVNPAFEKITGLKEKEVVGRRVTEVMPGIENDPAGWIDIYGRVALTGEDCRFEQYSARLGRWFSVSAFSPMKGFFVAIFEDITPRKQMEEELLRAKDELELRVKERTAELFEKSRELESFFKHTQTCLVFLDRDFNFIRINEAYAKTCSREVTDFEGRNHFVDFPSEELMAKFQQVVETKEPYSVSKQPFAFPDHPEWGTTYWDLTVAPVLDTEGDVDFLVLSMLDVTDRVQAEEQLFHLNRLYGMLSNVNIAILHTHEPDDLYRQLCRIAVEEGRFRMAWVGLLDPTTKNVVPAYSYGDTG
ncbi:MAG: PAS domain S-box protein, partial [Thermodesulfovibrionales bacterium]